MGDSAVARPFEAPHFPRHLLAAMVKHHSSQAENFRISSPNDSTLTFSRRDSRRIKVR